MLGPKVLVLVPKVLVLGPKVLVLDPKVLVLGPTELLRSNGNMETCFRSNSRVTSTSTSY